EGYFFSSEKLTEHWDALDEFEGIQYQRVRVQGTLESGEHVDAWIYEMKEA
ncbi:MAG: gamma-glutamylcyclotransferase, partial [Proteobacteria bacterium]|nr:gamma-glutamylcyclotransferase [Pseudomonadota bacterium]